MADLLRPVADRVYRLEDRFVNLYVLDLGKVVLVDTGTRRAEARIRAGLKEIGKEPHDIAVLLLTHHHADHVGTAAAWKREAGAEVHIHRDDAPAAAGQARRGFHGIGAKAKLFAVAAGLFAPLISAPPVLADRRLVGGETLDVLGWPVDVIHARGHTLGSVAFYARDAGILFAGDAVNGRAGKPEPPIVAEDVSAALKSYRDLVELAPPVLLPGHGSPVRNPRVRST